jgi:hypothetical protein
MYRMRRWLIVSAIAGATVAGALNVAPAAAKSTSSFAGDCQLSGVVRFDPPMTNTPQQGRVDGRATGSCTGTLTGPSGHARSVSGETVDAVVQSDGLESCEAGQAAGKGYLDFSGRRLHFTYTEVRVGPAFTFSANGARGGSGVLVGNVSSSADPAAIAQACGSTGLTQAPVDVRFTTTPAISG